MKMLVIHDQLGNIRSAAVAARESKMSAGLRPQHGESVIEIEVNAFESEALRRNPGLLSKQFHIDTASGTLMRKDRQPKGG